MNNRIREDDVRTLAISYGVAANEIQFAADGREAQEVAERYGRPVAIKLVADSIVHKSKAGGVLLGVSPNDVESQTEKMLAEQRRRSSDVRGVTVEAMVDSGLEVVVGGLRTPNFGPVAMFGQGGVDIEVLDDIAFAMAPLTPETAADLILRTRIGRAIKLRMNSRFLELVDLLIAVGGDEGMLLNEPITDIDLNPIVVTPDRVVAVDARARTLPAITIKQALPHPVEAFRQLRPAVYPEAVAVVGASQDAAKMGNRVVKNLVDFGFTGTIYPINKSASTVQGVKAFSSISELPNAVDKAVLTLPAKAVPAALTELAQNGVKTAHVYTADTPAFDAGLREEGLRVLGPNCMGHYAPHLGMTMINPKASGNEGGGIAFISQSGTYAGDAVRRGKELGIRFSFVSSVGNCEDIKPAELLAFCEADDRTTAVAFYLEDDRGAEEFFRIAQASTKPVILFKGGRTAAGSAAAASHTGAMAGAPQLLKDIARQSGVLIVEDFDHLLDVLTMIQVAPRVDGDGLALVGSGGGVAVVGSDKADAWSLHIPAFAEDTKARLAEFSAPGASLSNPIDVPIWSMFSDGSSYTGSLLEPAMADPGAAAAIAFLDLGTIFDIYEDEPAEELADLLSQGLFDARRSGKPLAVVLRSSLDARQEALVRKYRHLASKLDVAVFDSVDRAIAAIGGVRTLSRSAEAETNQDRLSLSENTIAL